MIDLDTPFFGKIAEVTATVKTFLYGIFIFLDIDVNIVKILAILMAIDTVLGVIKSIRLNRKVSFKRLVWGMITKVSVLIVPMVLALTAKALSFDFSWFVNAVLNILVLSEAFSAITNVISIKEGKELQNTDFITKLLHSVRNGLSSIINKLFNTINPEDKN
jgi:cobalamin biosynthesis protein CobD/CbiB